ncbi:hypothetical protein DOTSEDRAFT_68063 [Dothistroma septosporum NZE10]|uniref:Zn(2)-C6 fungal-type domain-containing protein n=1 Tax=Dothistroma septosporum (strain NZE10 / CBS 128990) TaxID=675120 RepID=N1Q3Z9_DOTSN|nr:hypothetical protein DOTSEDRAFT_68063 [Dothistroma septosporum NZE10]
MYPTSQSNQQPQQWTPNTQPANNQYQPRPNPNQLTPISQAVQQQGAPPAMQTLQPNHPDQYRALPPPQQMYGPPYQQAPQMAYPPTQPAPRQRTAIACRYCRRRKIRCSGFDQSEDGRCTNCQRFSQECVFTPVSAQTQAFVPAHTVWRGQNPPPNTQLYGAYGQPLPQHGNRDQYQQQQQQQQPGQYPPPPQGYQQQQPMYSQQGGPQAQTAEAGRKRPNDEPHTPTLAPPNPGEQSQMPQHRGADGQPYGYPDQSGLTPAGASPNSSSTSYYPAQHPPLPYYAQTQPQVRGVSPQSAYSYDVSRASSSPHALGQPGISTSFQHGVAIDDGRAPPASAANAQHHGGKVNDLAGKPKMEERTSTDSSMLQALNRGPK